MPSEWRELSLHDAGVELIDCEHRTPPPAASGYPYIAIPQLKSGRLDLSEARRISPTDFGDWTRKAKPQHHDVILSRRCNPGETAFVPAGLECALGQNLVLLRSDGRHVFPPFLRWLVRGPEWWEQIREYINVGAVFDSLTCAEVPRFRLNIPPLPTQRTIARILGALDDKIELNRKVNETLEQMARAIFKSWFVDFEPFRDKGMVDSPLGRVPKGWRVDSLERHVQVEKGLSYKGEGLADEGLPLHNLNSVYEGGGYKYEGLKRYTGEYRKRHIVRAGDLIVTNTEQGFEYLLIGFPAIVPHCYGAEGLFTHHLYRVRPLPPSPLTSRFLYFLLMSHDVREQVIGCTNGTTVNMLAADGLRRPEFPMPPADLVDRFDRLAAPTFDLMEQNVVQSRTLAAIRDALLPKLMSGKVPLTE